MLKKHRIDFFPSKKSFRLCFSGNFLCKRFFVRSRIDRSCRLGPFFQTKINSYTQISIHQNCEFYVCLEVLLINKTNGIANKFLDSWAAGIENRCSGLESKHTKHSMKFIDMNWAYFSSFVSLVLVHIMGAQGPWTSKNKLQLKTHVGIEKRKLVN